MTIGAAPEGASSATSAAPGGAHHELQRNLAPRHINLIAIGGAIGTGLFIATGASVATAGPGGAVLAYGVVGLAVYFIMGALGEMVTHRPVAGSFETYAGDYVDPALGFTVGWMYWYNCAMTMAVELVAAAIVMKYWFPDSSSFLWSGLFLAILLGLNLFSAKIFGEAEFWFAGIKVVTVLVFLVVGVAMILGILRGHTGGLANWTAGAAPFVGGWDGIFTILMVTGFSFVGVEAVAVTAGEARDPKRTMPKAVNSVFFRILVFYVGAILVVATIIPYTDPNLLNGSESNVAASPFTLVFRHAGLLAAAAVMNAVILTSVLSAGNSVLYVASRLLHSMALSGRAPRVLARTTRHGVPIWGVLGTTAIASLAFCSSFVGDSVVYTWLYNATGLSGFIVWVCICIAHLRFRAGWRAQGKAVADLPYRAKLYPVGTWFALLLCIAVIIGQGIVVALTDFTWYGMLVAYVGLPLAVALYLGFKWVRGTRIVPLAQMNLVEEGLEVAPARG